MNIEQINLKENYVRTCLQGSDRLVVGFENGGGAVHRPEPDRKAWGQDFVAKSGWDGLHILPKVLNWYQSPEIWDLFAKLSHTGFFKGYREVVMYGSSMGGFGALAMARFTGAKRVVAISPRSTLRWKVLPWKSRFSKKLKYNRMGERADVLAGLTPDIEVMIFVDPFFERDKRHCDRIADNHANTEVIRVPFIRHGIPKFLANCHLIGTVARSAIIGEFDKDWYYAAIRSRRDYPIYQKNVRSGLLKRRKAQISAAK